ncbi:hypothetical protein I6F65_06130 [Pseudoalteromonas sp. SWXJZ94C]|uniref:hypothetical protein n=1 Tax=Pseudoalteromonas sp. SWXJZ94C TaxID=2792065 RepID=UPI0018CD0483|nr:hypothetical protein [Pseudoalteromonas sp. SWXJZ94C]MBH0056531.1 hypothetical protein [Pseudoalteromonas sp. SWXJZ94C]
MNKKLSFNNGEISDNYASILVSHFDCSQVTTLLEYKGYKLVVDSCVDISLPDETVLSGPEVLKLVENKSLSLNELIAFLAGEESEKTDEIYEFEACAWFEWRSGNGDWASEPFDTMYESLDDNIKKLSELLEEEGLELEHID